MVAKLSSVTNALRVLKSFNAHDREWGVSDLARHLELGKSTVHRLLATMAEERVLEQHPETGRYRLGLAVFDLAAAVPLRHDLHEAVLAPMTELRNRSGETVQVAVLDRREVVYIERLDSPNTLRMFLEIGRRNHAHCTATGKVLLANLPEKELDRTLDGWELPAVTPHTITSIRKFRVELRQVRDSGYAENRHESEIGVVSLGAPIHGRDGKVVAAISIAGPAERIDPHRQKLSQVMIESAATASRRLGYRSTTASRSHRGKAN
jgi:IclR family transcriptional regulator, KDG regulon repressor